MRLRQQAGFSGFEWIAWLLITGVLILVLLQQLVHYQALARVAVMDMTVTNMRSGLRLRVAELMMANRTDEIGALLQQNPIVWLDTPPANYLGQLQQPNRDKLPLDSWYFDPGLHELIYLFQKSDIESGVPDGVAAGAKSLHVRVVARKRTATIAARNNAEGVSLELRYEK